MGLEVIDRCRLCGREAVLQNSHILPAAAHRNTKKDGRNVLLASGQGVFKRNNQSDFTESLLCFDCEQDFSKFEGLAINACRLAWKSRLASNRPVLSAEIRPLVVFAYSVFWRASISSRISLYKLPDETEECLKNALLTEKFPSPPELPISLSFLKVLDLPLTERTLVAPWRERLIAGLEVHYFSVFGIVFRMNYPYALQEIERYEFFRFDTQVGKIYPLQSWEEEMIDKRFTYEAVHAKFCERYSSGTNLHLDAETKNKLNA